jgi:hypothetical protein
MSIVRIYQITHFHLIVKAKIIGKLVEEMLGKLYRHQNLLHKLENYQIWLEYETFGEIFCSQWITDQGQEYVVGFCR